ncbi:MAG TPA: FlgD immunoglobulin-like domain containing protein [Candidatus Krumholzibacteria bacterium]|nr:FlgD immunoglobulin-like domain containing protein [Candidatus Krumholzibacteria bacterium]HPD72234.1 FlgD immunoglobulin-like domain containing protein [Candidatus Krumholzibacteria bacterium]HRY40834.1 FlgD immunoglobulin-like domain containing protein [Candidatus Krumholzibacteria bacterium]
MTSKILIAACVLSLHLASIAEARFIMFDAHFDNRAVGSSLDRRGARFGEPIEADGDNHSEVVVQDGPGDRSVQIWDTTSTGSDELTFALVDGREVVDGKLNISLELQLDSVDVYKVAIEGPNPNAMWFFDLTLDAAGIMYLSDADDFPLAAFDTYAAGDLLLIELSFNLNNGTYDFTLNGVPVLTNETHGLTAYGPALIVVGNQSDGNATGSVRLDNLSVDWAPGTADELLTANFNDEPIGQPIGTGGAALGQPIEYSGCTPTVENGGFATPALLIQDESTTTTSRVRFGFLNDIEATGDLSISFRLYFESLESYFVYLREEGTSAAQFLTLKFTPTGDVLFDDETSAGTHYHTESYVAQQPIHVELAYYAALGVYSVWMDGERVVHRREHGVAGRGIGGILFGASFDGNVDGQMRVDAINVDALDGTLTPVREDDAPALLPATFRAAPNPFNPATALRFTLPQAGRVQLDIVDLRGRRVRQLVSEALAAGEHAVTWQGTDEAGCPAASGVYQALLRVDGRLRERVPLTLVK